MKNREEFLKKHSKNAQSFTELNSFIEEMIKERDEFRKRLNLLERAISSDYDSILITTLELEKPGPRIVYVNDGFTKMTGYTREEVIGKSPRILQGPKTDKAVLERLKECLKVGRSFFGHTINYRKDGSEFINQWDIHPLTNENGELTHWVSYQHDITERKRSEKKVIDSQIEFDSLMEESKKTLIDIDTQGNIITSNKAFRDLIGYEDEELKTKKFWELLVDEQHESFKHKFDQMKPSDFNHANFDLTIKNRMGNPVEVSVKSRLLTIDDQKIIRASFENRSLQKRIIAMLETRGSTMDKIFDVDKDFRYALIPENKKDFVFKYLSDTFRNITGISCDDAVSISFRELVHPDDHKKVLKHFNRVMDGKPNTERFRIIGKDGDSINVIDYAKPVWSADHTRVEEIKGSTSTQISSVMSSSKN